MSKYLEEMNQAYLKCKASHPICNPEDEMVDDCLVRCECGKGYIVNLSKRFAYPPDNIKCKNCGALATDQTLFYHSGGCFNACRQGSKKK